MPPSAADPSAITLGWGEPGMYWAITVAESAAALVAFALFRRGTWKTTQL